MRKTLTYLAVPILLALMAAAPAYADIYRFVDESGTIHFSNVPEEQSSERIYNEDTAARKGSGGPAYYPSSSLNRESVPAGACGEPLPAEVPYAELINRKCVKYGVEPTLVKAIIKAESNFNPAAVSSKGARGLMQLMPETARELEVYDSFDPEQNIDGGVRYFRYLLDSFGGDVELAVAAYNCGQGRVIRNGGTIPDIRETKDYVKKVIKMSSNPVTGGSFSRPLYRVELNDGSILFTDNPVETGSVSLVD